MSKGGKFDFSKGKVTSIISKADADFTHKGIEGLILLGLGTFVMCHRLILVF